MDILSPDVHHSVVDVNITAKCLMFRPLNCHNNQASLKLQLHGCKVKSIVRKYRYFINDKFKEVEFEPLETPRNGTSNNPILNQAAFNLTMLIIGGVIGGNFISKKL